MAKAKSVKQLIQQLNDMFPTDDDCKRYLVARRWPEGVHCPRCGNVDVYPVTNRPFHWQCSKCAKAGGYRFSVLVGSIFENTNKPLRDWFRVINMMLVSKKGISALQVQRVMGFGSYETALYMCNRIRAGLSEHKPKLAGVVEVDETYIGGKDKNKLGTSAAAAVVAPSLARSVSLALSAARATSLPALCSISTAIRSPALSGRPSPTKSVCSLPTI